MVANTKGKMTAPDFGYWEVVLTDGRRIHETDITRTSVAPWLRLKAKLQKEEAKISDLIIHVGNLTSYCSKKNAKGYYICRRAIAVIGQPTACLIGHGYLTDDEKNVIVTWCGANGYSDREIRSKEKCESWMIR